MSKELQTFLDTWDEEAKKTVAMLQSLPVDKYDFRPDAGGRSLGELGWHLAEAEAYMTFGIEQGAFEMGTNHRVSSARKRLRNWRRGSNASMRMPCKGYES